MILKRIKELYSVLISMSLLDTAPGDTYYPRRGQHPLLQLSDEDYPLQPTEKGDYPDKIPRIDDPDYKGRYPAEHPGLDSPERDDIYQQKPPYSGGDDMPIRPPFPLPEGKYQTTRKTEMYTSPIEGAEQEKPLNVITAANWSRCGQYCEHVTECGVVEYFVQSKICNLFRGRKHLGRAMELSNASYFVSTRTDFINQKCTDDYKAVLKGETFVIESHGKKMNFEEEEGMFWRKKRATVWLYDNITLQIKVVSSSNCLVWMEESHSLLIKLKLATCAVSENQRFRLIQTANCAWKIRTGTFPGTEITSAGYDRWDEQNIRNLSHFKLSLDTFACDRFVVVNGELLPKHHNAPIFLEGDIFTIKCKQGYTLKRKESREKNVTLTCRKHDFRKVVCRNGRKSSTPQYIVLSLIGVCCLFLVLVFIRHVRSGSSAPEEMEEGRKNEIIEMRVRRQESKDNDSETPSAGCAAVDVVAPVGEAAGGENEKDKEEEDEIVKCCEIIPNPLNSCDLLEERSESESGQDVEDPGHSDNSRHAVLVHEATITESLHEQEHDSS